MSATGRCHKCNTRTMSPVSHLHLLLTVAGLMSAEGAELNMGGDVRFHTRMVRKLGQKLGYVWTRRWRCIHPWTSKPIMPCETVRRTRKKIMDKHTLNKTSSCTTKCQHLNQQPANRRRTKILLRQHQIKYGTDKSADEPGHVVEAARVVVIRYDVEVDCMHELRLRGCWRPAYPYGRSIFDAPCRRRIRAGPDAKVNHRARLGTIDLTRALMYQTSCSTRQLK